MPSFVCIADTVAKLRARQLGRNRHIVAWSAKLVSPNAEIVSRLNSVILADRRDATWCRETARSYSAQRPREVTLYRGIGRRHVLRRNRATPQRADKPRDTTCCRVTARRYVVQNDRATLRGAEGPRDVTSYRDHATPRGAEGPRDATPCRATARCHVVQRDRTTVRGAKRPRDATACREKSCKLTSFCDGDVARSTTGRFGPASGRTGRALPIPPHTRRRRTDSEYAECIMSSQFDGFRVKPMHAAADRRYLYNVSITLPTGPPKETSSM